MRSHRYASGVLLLLSTAVWASCRRDADPLQRLVRAASTLEQRPTTARVAAFPWSPPTSRSRALRAAVTPAADLLRVQLVASEILKNDSSGDHAKAVALLVSGRAEDAVRVLAALTEKTPTSAVHWSDLAAARYELGNERDEPTLHAAALAAADAALRVDPHYAPALFNRALALEALGLRPYAARAFTHYRSIDTISPWSREATNRLAGMSDGDRAEAWNRKKGVLEQGRDVAAIVRDFPQQTRTFAESDYLARWAEAHVAGDAATAARWLGVARVIGEAQFAIRGERLLSDAVAAIENARDRTSVARAHLTYREGRLLYRTNSARIGEALPLLHAAERQFARAGSPMAMVAAYYRANALFDAHDAAAAGEVLTRIESDVPAPYRALRAQLAWMRSTLAANSGRPYAALTAALASADQFRDLGETEHAARMEMAASRTLDRLGRTPEAYRLRRRAFESASAAGKPSLWEVLLNSAARYEVKAEHWDIAASLLALELESPPVSPLLRFDALLWRAVAEAKLQGRHVPDLRDARAAVARASEAAMREDMETELRFVEATAIAQSEPDRAAALLTSVIESRVRNTRVSNLASAYLQRARAHAHAGRRGEQEADLRSAIAFYERQAGEIQRDELRDAFSGTTADAYSELSDLLVRTERLAEAFEISEQARGRGMLAFESRRQRSGGSAALESLARRIADDVVLVHYTTLPEELLIGIIARDRPHVFTLPTRRADIDRHVRRLTRAIVEDDAAEQRSAARWLYDQLIAPIGGIPNGNTLITVPDDVLDPVPFAALVDPSGRYLVENVPVVSTPSARVFLAHAGEVADASHSRLALVADPAIDTATFPSLDRLPGARRDVYRLAGNHEATVLLDRDATVARVVDALQSATGAHIAAHALANESDAWKSLFVLTPDGTSDGALYLHQVVKLDLDRLRFVTLAGCRTSARGANSGSVSSLARAFLAAGSHNVIGTLWDVDDSLVSHLTSDLDAALHNGQRPAEALRTAQIAFLRSVDVRRRAARHWAAFQLHGCNH